MYFKARRQSITLVYSPQVIPFTLSLSLCYLSITVLLAFLFFPSLYFSEKRSPMLSSASPHPLRDSWLHAYLKRVWTEWLSVSLSLPLTYKRQQHDTHLSSRMHTHYSFMYSMTKSLSNSFPGRSTGSSKPYSGFPGFFPSLADFNSGVQFSRSVIIGVSAWGENLSRGEMLPFYI